MNHLVISVIAKDSPGLVEQLSTTVCQHQGNWVSSSMTQLAGQFTGIIEVNIAPEYQAALIAALKHLASLHIHVVSGEHVSPITHLQTLTVTGNDRPGIVHQVAHILNQRDINICKLHTETQSAPNWGYPLFIARFQLDVTETLDLDAIQTQLEQLADDLTIDFE
uniref:glycine cleavage system protein R n=1 Tax=Thaumasiovibrio occultus TaxID=1891184 RepID=UPI000B36270C|nr:ACT domain-containing protein [Thaumasiovibrio occultus]